MSSNWAGLHLKRADVNWTKVDERIRSETMASLGLRPLKLPIEVRPRIGAEWETRCEGCGIRVIYCTADQKPDHGICFCDKCSERWDG